MVLAISVETVGHRPAHPPLPSVVAGIGHQLLGGGGRDRLAGFLVMDDPILRDRDRVGWSAVTKEPLPIGELVHRIRDVLVELDV